MAWRFKASKYKNAAPIVPKPEVCVRDICVGSYQTYGNNIAASAAFMAFNWEHAGSSLAVLPIDDCGRKSKTMPLLHGHTDTVTDLHFSPFHDGLLATGSQDCLVKIWFIPEKGLESSLTEPECTFSHKQRRVETVGFHPAADCLLHSTSSGNVTLWDISQQKEVFSNNEHPDVIQSLSWKQDGTLMTTSCKDKIVRIMDPRISDPITMQALSHQSIKDSRVVWLGDQQRILTTGFDSSRLRQIIIRDLRKFDETEKTLELDCSTGILIPLYDADTNMLFLAGKGDTTISYMEVTDNAPYLIEGLRHNGEQTKGACLVPKRALRIMEGEVNRIMQLTSNSVIPIMYQVPRKTYRDFHSDLYPDTNGYKTDLSVQQWLNGVNVPVPKMSLDPAKRENGDQPIVIHKGNLDAFIKNQANRNLMKNVTNKTNTYVVEVTKNKYKIDKHQLHYNHQSSVIATSPKQHRQQSHQIVDDDNDHPVITKTLTKRELIKRFENKNNDTKMLINNNNDDRDHDHDDNDGNIGIKKIGEKIEEDFDDEINKDNNVLIDDGDDGFDDDLNSIINDNRMEEKMNMHEHPKNNGYKNNDTDHSNGDYVMNTTTNISSSIPSIPPKPLPRTSRNNSMSDQGNNNNNNNNHNKNINNNNRENNQQTEINLSTSITTMTNTITTTIPITTSVEEDFDNKYPLRPVARPRTTTSYKPRLGPKPFTSSSCSGDISFDKVFSVPQAPGNESLEHDHLNNTSTESSESSIDEQKQSDNSEKNLKIDDGNEEKEHYNNGNHGTTNDDNNNNNNDDHQNDDNVDDVDDIDVVDIDIDNNNLINKDSAADGDIIRNAKNKLSDEEEIIKDMEDEEVSNEDTNESQTFMDTADDKIDTNLERLSMNRCSIAERRKIYENRSLSSQEERTVMAPPQSPLPSSKKELIQNRMESIQNVDDNKTKFHHHHLEHSKTFDDATNGHQNNRSSKHNNGGGGGIMDIKKNSLKNQQSEPNSATKRTSTVFGKVSKFRHLKGTPGHKSTHIENIRNISRQIPGECNGFHANHQRVAVPISGPGGKIAVYELNKPGRLPDGVIPSLVNSSNIMDFQWDPFDSHKLVVACDDGIVKIWNIPENGLLEPTNTCDSEFPAHSDKIYFIRFHPLAQNVLLTASYDMTMKLWDLNTMTEKICLQGHTEQIFDFAWSPCGELGASVCKDGKIRIFNPRKSLTAILEGNGPIGTRGARIAWALGGQYILCTGFDKVSERQISIYKLTNLSTPLNVVGLDVSPAILMLFYDEDSSTVLLTGRGDSTIYAFEITDEAPHICPLSHHRCPTLHQGLSFLTKNYCDVVAVEFAKALRLTNNTIEPLSFTVPRIKTELFQDDLFPPTRITWSPTMSSVEWFSLKPCTVKKINLQPDGMECLTTVQQAEKQNTKKTEIAQTTSQNVPLYPHNRLGFSSESDKAKQKEIQQSVSARMEYTTKLEQDDMEGVEEKEWDE